MNPLNELFHDFRPGRERTESVLGRPKTSSKLSQESGPGLTQNCLQLESYPDTLPETTYTKLYETQNCLETKKTAPKLSRKPKLSRNGLRNDQPKIFRNRPKTVPKPKLPETQNCLKTQNCPEIGPETTIRELSRNFPNPRSVPKLPNT